MYPLIVALQRNEITLAEGDVEVAVCKKKHYKASHFKVKQQE